METGEEQNRRDQDPLAVNRRREAAPPGNQSNRSGERSMLRLHLAV